MLKTVVLLHIFGETKKKYFLGFFSEWNAHKNLCEIKMFWNIINDFTVTFNQFNTSLLNKRIHFLMQKNIY